MMIFALSLIELLCGQSFAVLVKGFWIFWLFHLSVFLSFVTQARSSLLLRHLTKGTQYWDSEITSCSSFSILNLIWPSKVTQAPVLASSGSTILITTLFGNMIGLKESEWAAIGVKQTTSEVSWTIEPPQERL